MSNDPWVGPRRSQGAYQLEADPADGIDHLAPQEQQMTDHDESLGARAEDSSSPWDELADQAHDDGQAVLDALARRARRLGRRIRRAKDAPVRILKLMD